MFSDDLNKLRKSDYIDWGRLRGKVVYISGATGLIGSNVVETLLACSNCKVIVQVRNKEKAREMFGDNVECVVCDLMEKCTYTGNVDFIIHCANPTSSRFFIEKPVETIKLAINGTINILEFAKEKKPEGVLFLSTMEVYGTPEKGHKVKENEGGSFDSTIVRNCYPLSKQTCESLCASYASEYGVHAKILRLTQTFGPGVSYNDGRVFAEFARCAIEKKNIVLKTKGETERDYLYTSDAVSAIFTVLMRGKDGDVYTAANEETFCSIYEMAQLVAKMSGIDVVIEEQDISNMGYADTFHMDLDTLKLRKLGWKPSVDLEKAFKNLIIDMENSING